MCGRFALFAGPEELARHFGVTIEDVTAPDRYNIAPTQPVLIIRRDTETGRRGVQVRWGLIPPWAKDESIGNRMINARSETVADKPAWRGAFRTHRCLVPASGFYEWQVTGAKRKQPYFIRSRDSSPLAFAGLWARWRPEEDQTPIESCTILTTEANATMAPIHDRMPVILAPADYAAWLGEAPATPEALRALLRPAPDDRLVAVPVSTAINNPRHDGPDCITPITGR